MLIRNRMIHDKFIEINGIKIHYLAQGTHDPNKLTLLFVPGIMMPAWIWEKQFAYFDKKYNVVAMEPRSHGDSSHATGGHDAFTMAKDIRTFVQALNLEPLILIGWSLAVPQVVNYAAHFASKGLAGIVLVDGVVGIDASLPFYQGMVDYWAKFPLDRDSNTSKFVRSIFKQPQNEDYWARLNDAAMKMPTNIVMTLMNNYIHQDFRSLLPGLNVPAFIATIEGPRLDYMHTIHEKIPFSKMEIFESAGHALFVDQAEKFNRSLEAFIEKNHSA